MKHKTRIGASTRAVLAELVDLVLDDFERRTPPPPTGLVTGQWIDESRPHLELAIAETMKLVINVPPQFRDHLEKLLRDIVMESWKITNQQLRPRAWVDKFWAAETDADRERIFMSAVKYNALEAKRKKEEEEKRFVSLDALEERARDAWDHGEMPAQPVPSVTENLEAGLLKEKLHVAMLELPILLAVIAYMMLGAEGNASKLGRYLDIPQKQMSRHLAKIREVFRRHGLNPAA
ncbi:MAG: hypothetical protein KGI84_09915 [Elusimicrobia bacterium]|nr:hypothetical protein [Elusimicrobiota bacterium]